MKNFYHLAPALCLAVISLAAHAEGRFAFDTTPGKLPKDVVPQDYAIHVVPDLEHFTFSGSEDIHITVRSSTRSIVLNANHLDIDAASLRGPGNRVMQLKPELDAQQQTLRFTLAQALAPGQYTLSLAFRGVINTSAQGLYYDRYRVGALDKIMIGTNLEATDARSVFPCWDEPVFRARFKMSADAPASFMAISNMPVQHQQALPNGWKRWQFAMSPTMSTYLVVLAAGELERSSAMQDGTEIGVVTTAGKQTAAAYALKISQQLVHYYNDYFGVRYPLPKLDQIAVPGGFGGAMENWGGVIYNETTMLFDPTKSPVSTQQRAFSTIAHETAHQWFGNLVTMAWWDNLWLNESFASWMEAKATDHFNPQWHAALGANDGRETAMAQDALPSAHPIYQRVDNEAQAADAFDRITYEKGQAFVRMLEAYLGEVPFRQGIRRYIAKHQYANTTSADLWAELSKASGKAVEPIARDWTMQSGFPLIMVDAQCKNGMRTVHLQQQQFLLDHGRTSDRLWTVPVQIGLAGDKPDYVLLSQRSQTVTRPGCQGALVLDPQSVGYYRVQYAPDLLAPLLQELPQLPDRARVKVATDMGVLFNDGRLPVASFFDMVTALAHEPRLAVWTVMLDQLAVLDEFARDDTSRPALRRWAIDAVRPLFDQLGWDSVAGESVDKSQLRAALLSFLSHMGDEATIAQARARFDRFLVAPKSLDPALLNVVMFTVGRNADQATFDKLFELAGTAEGTEEKNRFYGAAFSVLDAKVAAQAMPLALSKDLPPLVSGRVLPWLSNEHASMVWAYAQQHADALMQMQPEYARNEIFPTYFNTSTSASDADGFEAYVKAHQGADALTLAQRAAEGVRLRAQRKERLLPQLAQWLGRKSAQ